MFRLVLWCTVLLTFLCFPVHVRSGDEKQIIVTPKFLQNGFKWNLDFSSWFSLSRSNKKEAAMIREEIQKKVDKDSYAVELEVSDYKNQDITKKELKEITKEATEGLEKKTDGGFMKKFEDMFKFKLFNKT
ncbi:CRYAB family protein [Megaselia abdita]